MQVNNLSQPECAESFAAHFSRLQTMWSDDCFFLQRHGRLDRMPRHSPAAQSVPATTGCIKRGTVVQGDSKSWGQYPLSLTPDVRHSLQALALCKMLVERGIDINHGDVAWSNLEVKLQGQWPSWNPVPTYVKGFDKIRLPTPGLNLS